MAKPIAYVHIPKTAGNAVNRFLLQEIAPGKILERAEDRTVTPDDFGKCDLAMAHLPFMGFKKRFGERQDRAVYLSCIREPFSRLMSNLYYSLTIEGLEAGAGPLKVEDIREKGFEWAVATALELEDHRIDYCRNLQWLYLMTDNRQVARRASQVEPGLREAIAEEFLKSYAGVIVQERLDEGIAYLGYRTRLLVPHIVGRQNSNEVKPSDNRYAIKDEGLIEEVCGLDRALYDVAKREFDTRYEEMVADVLGAAGRPESAFRAADREGRYEILRDLVNRQILAERENAPLSGGGSPAAAVLGRAGVYPGATTTEPGCRLISGPGRQQLKQNGRPVTDVLWVGPAAPAEFWVRPAAAGGAAWLAFRIGACLSHDCLSELKIACNGGAADYRIASRGGDWLILVPLAPGTSRAHVVMTAPDVPHIYDVDAQASPITRNVFHKVAVGIDEEVHTLSDAEAASLPTVEPGGGAPPSGDGAEFGPITLVNNARISEAPSANGVRLEKLLIDGPQSSTVVLRAGREWLSAPGTGTASLTFYFHDGQRFTETCRFEDGPDRTYAEARIGLPLGPAATRLAGIWADGPNGNGINFHPCDNVASVTSFPLGSVGRLVLSLGEFLRSRRPSAVQTGRLFHIGRILTREQDVSAVMLYASKAGLRQLGGSGPFSVTFLLGNGQRFESWCFFEDVPNSPFARTRINVALGQAIRQLVGFTVDDRDRNRLVFQMCDNVDAITTAV